MIWLILGSRNRNETERTGENIGWTVGGRVGYGEWKIRGCDELWVGVMVRWLVEISNGNIKTGLEINLFLFKAYWGLVAIHISKGVRILIHVTLQRSKIVDGVVGRGCVTSGSLLYDLQPCWLKHIRVELFFIDRSSDDQAHVTDV